METLLAWGLALIGLGVILVLVDLLLPTGGMLIVLASLSAIGGIVCLFRYDTTWGLVGTLGVLVLAPALVVFGVKVWPHTPVGRRVFGVVSEEELAKQREQEESARKALHALVGEEGVVLTDLRPVGVVEVRGTRYDALSELGFVRAGTRVKVTVAEHNQVKVRPLA